MTSVTSILPGTLVQSLVTAVVPDGLNLQVLGYFGGTIDQYHLVPGDPEENYKVGQKLKARVLYNVADSSPPRFALSLAEHLIALTPKSAAGSGLPDAYPIGTTLDAVKVSRVETERGLVVEVSDGAQGYVHVRTNQALSMALMLIPKLPRYHRCQTIMFPRYRRPPDTGRSGVCTKPVLLDISRWTAISNFRSDKLSSSRSSCRLARCKSAR